MSGSFDGELPLRPSTTRTSYLDRASEALGSAEHNTETEEHNAMPGNAEKKRPAVVAAVGGADSADGMLATGATAVFFSKSKDADDLGLGRPDWRRVLSNFYPAEITVDGRLYYSVEHAFHAAKARCSSNPSAAAHFEIGSGRVPKDPLAAKKAGGRSGFKKLGIVLDIEQWRAQRDIATMAALRARLSCDDLFRRILAAVHKKELTLLHFERGGTKSYWGGNIRKADGVQVGRNRLGEMLMDLAKEVAADASGGSSARRSAAAAANACAHSRPAKRSRRLAAAAAAAVAAAAAP
jgi:ribA/ribD-fused uncharacterized protein